MRSIDAFRETAAIASGLLGGVRFKPDPHYDFSDPILTEGVNNVRERLEE
jgi:hypothetical protein